MWHDMIPFTDLQDPEYRKYLNEPQDCRGLMDYVDDGTGWSKCSMMDFSRYLTSGGKKKPCI